MVGLCTRLAIERAGMETPHLKRGAPDFYPSEETGKRTLSATVVGVQASEERFAEISSLRERSGKKPGGQKGHPGDTLRQSETVDAAINHFPKACAGCGEALSEAMATDHIARQVFDLPEPQPLIVTEHRAHSCR